MSAPTARATPFGRLAVYLWEMFPPLAQVPMCVALFGTIYVGLQCLGGRSPVRIGWIGVAGAVGFVSFALLLRVYDELKDVETDLRLGQAGDPRYRDRAIVTGRVQVGDLVALRWGISVLLIVLHVPLGWPWPGAAFVVAFALTWLSFKWFFWPAVSRNLLLAFVTHNPLAVVVGAWVMAVYVRAFGVAPDAWAIALMLLEWMPVAAWETARKVRAPADETDYQTYSKLLGHRVAALLPVAFSAVGAAAAIALWLRLELSWIYPAGVVAVTLGLAGASVRFVLRPGSATANLRPFAEAFGVVATAGFVAACCASAGVRF